MEKKRIRIAGAVASVLLVLADANVALAVPIAPLSQPDATSPTLARMGGGGFHGGYHGGHNVVVNQRTNVVAGRGGYHGGYHGGHNVVVNRNTNVVVGRGGMAIMGVGVGPTRGRQAAPSLPARRSALCQLRRRRLSQLRPHLVRACAGITRTHSKPAASGMFVREPILTGFF